MAYLCSFIPRADVHPYSYERSPLGEARIITGGIACTSREILTELETKCRARRGTLSFEQISPESVDTWREHYREAGQRVYLNREGFL